MELSSKEFTVSEIIDLTGQKRGTIEQFRRTLKRRGAIRNNQPIDSKALKCFKVAIATKRDTDCQWVTAIEEAILAFYPEVASYVKEDESAYCGGNMVKLCEFIKIVDNAGESVFVAPHLVEAVDQNTESSSTIVMQSGKRYTVHGDPKTVSAVLMGKADQPLTAEGVMYAYSSNVPSTDVRVKVYTTGFLTALKALGVKVPSQLKAYDHSDM